MMMISQNSVLFVIYIIHSLICNTHSICDKTSFGIANPRTKVFGGRYYIEIPGNPKTYTPHQTYNISLRVVPQKTFKHFVLTVESENSENDETDVGHMDLSPETKMLARFSNQCPNTLVESSVVPKSEIQVFWTAPPKDSGCVLVKATVIESKYEWYGDDEWLTKQLCEENAKDENVQPEITRRCCACQEAKYEVAFEGKWTRNTHPRHFPSDQWATKFSDIVGASHQLYHAFWSYENYATEGLKELADTGVTKTLEAELKNNGEHIRTIIKARGLQFPNITKSTYAVFRVDSRNHLVSLVSKIIPSPDWIVGVANLELCRQDCTWEEAVTLNLYPWDVGINDGLGYTSSEPSREQHPVRRITANYPNNPDSPFYSESGEDIQPIAKLHLTRQRLYDKVCEESSVPEEETDCATTDWSEWSPCTARCGVGQMFRRRDLREANENCDVDLVEVRNCYGRSRYCNGYQSEGEAATEEVEETTELNIEESDSEEQPEEEDPNCPGTFWGNWSKCNATCNATGSRSRFLQKRNSSLTDEEWHACFKLQTENCTKECDKEEDNQNGVFQEIESASMIASEDPDVDVVDCEVSVWSKWSKCHLYDKKSRCGVGIRLSERRVVRNPQNGGKACPDDLVKTKDCEIKCHYSKDRCIMSDWSNWTPCTANCGSSAIQIRTRNIEHQPPGVVCNEKREETRICKLPLACNDNGNPIF